MSPRDVLQILHGVNGKTRSISLKHRPS